ncbi:hypothetical protein AB0L40_16885 [Patulibacter sp. NPDC049589]|uniref:hypothetical protein n=1 Tax=Patulibacter sp. NPDC049589 TaxID=3154731 RepID=UPI0034163ECC
MRIPSPRAASLLAASSVLLLVPATAGATSGGVDSVVLGDARPGAVPRPLTIRVAQPASDAAPKEVRIAVQGLTLDPGTTSGRRIGTLDLDTTLGAFSGLAVSTAGPGDGAPGRWSLATPGFGSFSAAVRPGTDLDAAGAPVATAGSTLIAVAVPTDLPLGAKLTSVTLRLNVDEQGCATSTPAATNPAAAGSYRVRAYVGAADGTSRVSDAAAVVAADAKPQALPSGCPAVADTAGGTGGGSAKKPKVSLAAAKRRLAPGGRTTVRVRVANGPADVTVRRGSRTVKTLQRVGTSARSFVFRAARADAGRLVTLTVRPKGGTAAKLRIRVARR